MVRLFELSVINHAQTWAVHTELVRPLVKRLIEFLLLLLAFEYSINELALCTNFCDLFSQGHVPQMEFIR